MLNSNQALTPIYALTLMLAAAPACAEWVKIGTSRTAVHYVDPATVRKDGHLRRVWVMQSMIEADGNGVMSIWALQEYDCAKPRFRYLAMEAYSGPLGGGENVVTHQMRDGWSNRASAIGKMVCRD